MNGRIFLIAFPLLTALALASCKGKPAEESGARSELAASLAGAAPVGAPVSAIVELSDLYHAPETYDAKITVLEVQRGAPAIDLLAGANRSNPPALDGFEYLLARVRFEFAARGAPGDKTWEPARKQFSAFSGQGALYEALPAALPQPELRGELRSGDSCEGWLAFAVSKEDQKPVLTFSPASIWFRLF